MTTARAPAVDELVPVMELLHSAQERRGYISEDDVLRIAAVARMPPGGAVRRHNGLPPLPSGARPADRCRLHRARLPSTRGGCGSKQHIQRRGNALPGVVQSTARRIGRQRHLRRGPRPFAVALPSQRRLPTISVPESVFFADDDPFEAVRTARNCRPTKSSPS